MNLSNRWLVLAVFCVQLAMAGEVVATESAVEQEAIQQKWAYVKTIIPDKAVLDFKTAWLNKVLYPGLCMALGGFLVVDHFLSLSDNDRDSYMYDLYKWINGATDSINYYNAVKIFCCMSCSTFIVSCIINIFNNRSLPGITFNKQARRMAISSSAKTLLCVSPDCLPDEVASIVKQYKEAGSSDEEQLVSDVVSAIATNVRSCRDSQCKIRSFLRWCPGA